jgi:hypothetical protein
LAEHNANPKPLRLDQNRRGHPRQTRQASCIICMRLSTRTHVRLRAGRSGRASRIAAQVSAVEIGERRSVGALHLATVR